MLRELRNTLILCFFIILFVVAGCTYCYSADDKYVKVAVVDNHNFFHENTDGTYCGYSYDYLTEISRYTGWKYEFIKMSSEKAKTELKKGNIDILPGYYNENHDEDNILLPEYDMGNDGLALCVDRYNSDYAYNDYKKYNGMRVGVIKYTSSIKKQIKEFKEDGIDLSVREFDNKNLMDKALKNKKIDAVILNNIKIDNRYKIISQLDVYPIYFACGKNSGEICKKINSAWKNIHADNCNYEMKLQQNYYGMVLKSTEYTQTEKRIVSKIEEINIGIYVNNTVMSSYNEKKGRLSGILIDTLDVLAQKSGLRFKYVPMKDDYSKYSEDFYKKNKISFIVCCSGESSFANGCPSTDYFFSCVAMMGINKNLKDSGGTDVIAIQKDIRFSQWEIANMFPCVEIKKYPSVKKCIKALEDGKVNGLFANQFELQKQLENENDKITIASNICVPQNYYLSAISSKINMQKNSNDNYVISILNKGIKHISVNNANQIINENTIGKSKPYTLGIFVYKFRNIICIIGVLMVALFIAYIIILQVRGRSYSVVRETNIKLNNALEHANKSSKAKSDFLARMSHDMRTPMNAIIGFSDKVLTDNADIETMRQNMNKINSSGEYLLSLINDILDFSKIENNRTEFNYKKDHFDNFFSEIKNVIIPMADEKGIDLQVKFIGLTEKTLIMDTIRTKQIFINLLTNAVKFTPSGGKVEFIVKQLRKTKEKVYVRFIVKDNGCGISKEYLPKIYDAFSQEDNDINSFNGIGMGLSIVKKLVDAMNGTIKCSSKKGKGTQFEVMLAFGVFQKCGNFGENKTDESLADHINIMVVEDNEVSAQLAIALLELKDIKSIHIDNGIDALNEFGKSPEGTYDAILMDVNMPGIDGLETTRRIRALNKGDAKRIPIIAMTANAYADDVTACINSGMNEHMSKPIRSEDLYSILKRYVMHN